MKARILVILVLTALSLTSCINIIEEIFLERDGSGRFVCALDFSRVLDVKGIIMEGVPQASVRPGEKVDTTIYLADLDIDSSFTHPGLIRRSIVKVQSDEPNGVMKLTLEFDFNRVEEVNMLLEDLQRGAARRAKKSGTNFPGLLSTYNYSNKTLDRTTRKFETLENEEYAPVYKAFFATTRLRTIYHMPGKILQTTIPDAVVKKRTCEVEIAYGDFLSGKKSLDGAIRFR